MDHSGHLHAHVPAPLRRHPASVRVHSARAPGGPPTPYGPPASLRWRCARCLRHLGQWFHSRPATTRGLPRARHCVTGAGLRRGWLRPASAWNARPAWTWLPCCLMRRSRGLKRSHPPWWRMWPVPWVQGWLGPGLLEAELRCGAAGGVQDPQCACSQRPPGQTLHAGPAALEVQPRPQAVGGATERNNTAF